MKDQERQIKSPPIPSEPKAIESPPAEETIKRPGAPVSATGKRPAIPQWYLQTPQNEIFGPVEKPELDNWLSQGSITAECQILRVGDDQWKWATDVYPQLMSAAIIQEQKRFCRECGESIRARAEICPACGVRQAVEREFAAPGQSAFGGGGVRTGASKNKMAAGICGILLGSLGIHKFILGYKNPGIIMLLVGVLGSCLYGVGFIVMAIFGIIEGITYLTMSDDDFDLAHNNHTRPWF